VSEERKHSQGADANEADELKNDQDEDLPRSVLRDVFIAIPFHQ
jgi:hypothetical protein